MERQWYLRFLVVVATATAAWLSLWPSLGQWMSVPAWVETTFEGRINPGLDIRGGIRLMYEVEVDEYLRDKRDRDAEQLLRRLGVLLDVIDESEVNTATREQLQQVQEKVTVQRVGRRAIRALFTEASDRELFTADWLQENFDDLRLSAQDGNRIDLEMREDRLEQLRDDAVKQAQTVIDNRVNALGLGQAEVSSRESDVIVEVPGASEEQFQYVRSIISRTARLEFKVVDDENDFIGTLTDLPEGIQRFTEPGYGGEGRRSTTSYLYVTGSPCAADDVGCVGPRQQLQQYIETLSPPEDHQLVVADLDPGDRPEEDADAELEAWRTYYLYRTSNVSGEDVDDARVGFDPQEGTVVYLTFNAGGAVKWEEMTGANVKRRVAIVLDERVESAPVIQERIGGGSTRITLSRGVANPQKVLQEANDLVVVLKAGALPAPLREANSQLIGPTLGQDSVRLGTRGAVVGISLVLLFMMLYYEVAGIVSALAVVLNLLFMLGIMSALSPPLTLPGIASLALTVGMAVDANVLIIERIREELRLGKSARAAVDQGFRRAMASVFDSQLTTFIAGVVLYQYGTGPIKGFAVMLLIGIITSLFTGIFCSKVMMDFVVRGLKVKRLRVG